MILAGFGNHLWPVIQLHVLQRPSHPQEGPAGGKGPPRVSCLDSCGPGLWDSFPLLPNTRSSGSPVFAHSFIKICVLQGIVRGRCDSHVKSPRISVPDGLIETDITPRGGAGLSTAYVPFSLIVIGGASRISFI